MINNEVKIEVLYNSKKKSMLAAYLIGAFLGGIGAHYFYLGRKEFGFAMLGSGIVFFMGAMSGNENIIIVSSLVHTFLCIASFVHTYYICNEVNAQLRDECVIMVED
tara:strand:- start:323 stop:643 length:321 start_codon:yes stop_codon:yes gene_type:complete